MKKITTILFAGLLSIVMVNTADAQIEVGAGLVLGTGAYDGAGDVNNDIGLKVDGRYDINEQIAVGADFTFFFPKDESGVKFKLSALNLNGFYDFLNEEEFNLYGLAGLNIAFWEIEFPDVGGFFGGGSISDTEIGLNIGAGAEYVMNFGNLFGEVKYVISDLDQLVIAAGVRIPVGGN
ncbi:outer membrane beta-barrel protein [Balneola sp. MJW-20]|uniref:outer membrane beta-barrel protein n=1 Tax=Gracilimonas aurantiaca TaxID=3234185 RepID=UPI0034668DEA